MHDGSTLWAARRRVATGTVPVVYVHGAGSDHGIWGYQLGSVAADNVALDLPGHGRSDGPGRARIEDYASDVVLMMDALEIDAAVVVGHSMGGAIAQLLALDRPGRVLGLVLLGTGARLRVRDELRSGFLKDHVRAGLRLVALSFASEDAGRSHAGRAIASLAAIDPAVVAGDFEACHGFDVMDRVDEIRVPTLAICGALDVLTPPNYTRWLGEHIPSARVTIVPGAGHMAMLERPADVTSAIGSVVTSVVGDVKSYGAPKSDTLG